MANRLLSTKEASQECGLSEYELRIGYKQGRYPALEIGSRNSSVKRLRWNLPVLMDAIQRQMDSYLIQNQEG